MPEYIELKESILVDFKEFVGNAEDNEDSQPLDLPSNLSSTSNNLVLSQEDEE